MQQVGLDPEQFLIQKRIEKARDLTPEEEIEFLQAELIRLKSEIEKPKEDPQKVVNEDELESYLAAGWKFLGCLPSGRVIIGQ